MNNYGYYCEKCNKFFTPNHVHLDEQTCPNCNNVWILHNCIWHLNVSRNSSEYYHSRIANAEKVIPMFLERCEVCENKFDCWTGNLT
jgi:predicted nucleic acid-binding Zn ribbon protein